MAVPKRKQSKSRTSKRRANWKLGVVSTNVCPQCREPKLPHRACLSCGSYDGREAIKVKDAK